MMGEGNKRRLERDYVDIIPVSIRLNYMDENGRMRWKQLDIPNHQWDDDLFDELINLVETEHNLPLRRKD